MGIHFAPVALLAIVSSSLVISFFNLFSKPFWVLNLNLFHFHPGNIWHPVGVDFGAIQLNVSVCWPVLNLFDLYSPGGGWRQVDCFLNKLVFLIKTSDKLSPSVNEYSLVL